MNQHIVAGFCVAIGLASSGVAVAGAKPPQPVTRAKELGVPFDRYETKDEFGRAITYYLSIPAKDNARKDNAPARDKAKDGGGAKEADAGPVALVVWIQGSGCNSVFSRTPDGKTGGGLQMLMLKAVTGRARVVVVEKPGVTYLDNPKDPGTATNCAEEFNREQTLARWSAAVGAALESAEMLPGIDSSRVLVAGHSEGGIVAAAVAARHAEVTHIAVLAGGGPSQLFDMAEVARRPRFEGEAPGAAEQRVEEVYKAWGRIMEDPASTTKFEWGHPYRRWSTFLASSTLEELLKSKAKVFIAYGTADMSVPVESNDVLRAELVRHGREVTCERIAGVDHGFAEPGGQPVEGFRRVLGDVAEWFVEDKDTGKP